VSESKAKVVFILNNSKLSGWLTWLFTGCTCYHVGIIKGEWFYDMYWMRRRTIWKKTHYYEKDQCIYFESPVTVPEQYLINKIIDRSEHYGVWDYMTFGLKPLLKKMGISIKNMKGTICSEQVNEDLMGKGWNSPWPNNSHPPSPCKMLDYFLNKYKRLDGE